jgi:hydrogenase/urease accessory protein HupE
LVRDFQARRMKRRRKRYYALLFLVMMTCSVLVGLVDLKLPIKAIIIAIIITAGGLKIIFTKSATPEKEIKKEKRR